VRVVGTVVIGERESLASRLLADECSTIPLTGGRLGLITSVDGGRDGGG